MDGSNLSTKSLQNKKALLVLSCVIEDQGIPVGGGANGLSAPDEPGLALGFPLARMPQGVQTPSVRLFIPLGSNISLSEATSR
jgi:hypothetical protein